MAVVAMLFAITDLMRTVHMLAGGVWVGGSVVYLLVILPALRVGGAGAATGALVGALFRRLVNVCIGLLLLSGVYLIVDRLTSTRVGAAYVVTLVIKVLAALAMFGLAAYQAQEARRLARKRGRLWKAAPHLILWLGVLTFLLGATLTGLYEASLIH
ncbi:MAG TPA: hypothetical protein VKQ30_13785 [Ktedonobacterales bacterium]|nr:hypothetical protein [Ktedonobacterales bacterium]